MEVHAIILNTTKALRVRAKGHLRGLLITCMPYPTKLRAYLVKGSLHNNSGSGLKFVIQNSVNLTLWK